MKGLNMPIAMYDNRKVDCLEPTCRRMRESQQLKLGRAEMRYLYNCICMGNHLFHS